MFKKLFFTLLAALLVAGPAAALEYTSQDIVTLRASAAHTTTTTVQFVNNGNHCGAYIYVDVTAEVDTATLTVTMDIVEASGGATVQIDGFTAITATGEYVWIIHPVLDATLITDLIIFILPRYPY